jgi:toxin ParE1/3/4
VKSRRLIIVPEVEADIAEIATYLAQFSMEVALRFNTAAYEAIDFIGHNATFGSPKYFRNKQLTGFRSWWIKGFKNYLIFYQLSDSTIKITAVTHSARHLPGILKDRQ